VKPGKKGWKDANVAVHAKVHLSPNHLKKGNRTRSRRTRGDGEMWGDKEAAVVVVC